MGVVITVDVGPGGVTVTHVHLVLVGWIVITIMGAMTQFVPVWSGVPLHSDRLATLQLWLVTSGVVGFSVSLLLARIQWAPVFGAGMLIGIWVFGYNIGRTMWELSSYDVTERHFGLAVGFFFLVTGLGFLLAVDFVVPVFGNIGLRRSAVIETHATFAVFGTVMTTIIGALYQLATMFTQTTLHGVDRHLRRFEEGGYPLGVVFLGVGRLIGSVDMARAGGLLVVLSLIGVSFILARRLIETQVDWTPMLRRYAVAAAALALWGVVTGPVWLDRPLGQATRFGAPATHHVLLVGTIGFVILGTLYHVIPFIIWVHRYSDRLGYEAVPMIDDLYSRRIAAVDFGCLTVGTVVVVGSDWYGAGPAPSLFGGALILLGVSLFLANVVSILHRHSPLSLWETLVSPVGSLDRTTTQPTDQPDHTLRK